MKRFWLNIVVGFLLIVVAGCGFQLRGATTTTVLSASLQTIYIQGLSIKSGLGLELKRALTRNGVTVVTTYQSGSAVLTILENNSQRRVLSVDAAAKVSEYEIHNLLTFSVSDDQGQIMSEQQTVQARRDYQFDQDQVLGKDEEERLLRQQLDRQLAQSILRRLSALK